MNRKMPSFALRKTAFCSLKHGLSDGILPHIGNSLNARRLSARMYTKTNTYNYGAQARLFAPCPRPTAAYTPLPLCLHLIYI